MIRRSAQRRGVTLLTMVALIPMVFAITAVSAMLVNRVLRVQREATYRVVNTETACRLANQLRIDAANATSVTLNEQANRVVLTNAESETAIEYAIDDGVVVRDDSNTNAPNLSEWSFVHAKVQISLEKSVEIAPLIWLRVEYEVELQKKLIQVAKMTTAIHVGDGETQR
jgi:hypothetical protein